MVIKYPTGLYDPLPTDNVTWYISSNPPPRSNSSFQQIPIAEEVRPAPPKVYPTDIRRKSMAELIYSIIEPSRTEAGSAKLQFEVGQVLDFVEEDLPTLTIPSTAGIQIKHNTNVLDLQSLGLDDKTTAQLYKQATDMLAQLNKEYDIYRTRVTDIETSIRENQKNINEVNKTINAVKIIGDESILKQLNDKLTAMTQERTLLAAEHELNITKSNEISDKMLEISQLVR